MPAPSWVIPNLSEDQLQGRFRWSLTAAGGAHDVVVQTHRVASMCQLEL